LRIIDELWALRVRALRIQEFADRYKDIHSGVSARKAMNSAALSVAKSSKVRSRNQPR